MTEYNGFSYDSDREIYSAARVRALESLLIEKGIISGETVDKVLNYFETEMGPFNGAKIVAKAWTNPEFKASLLENCNAAVSNIGLPPGMSGAEGEHMKIVENTPEVHNLIICTLCSCYPWPTLGLPPYWYKDPTFRARAAREPRAVLKEFGVDLGDDVTIHVWDSSAQIRWFVLPQRPTGTEGMSEAELAALVTPEAMMGVALVESPSA
ncbi:nitrile hydratase subunit alpha [Myxosarcina sp. GI1]|uniref:nitrile hydratase subunit alpha n=1 Tax=Myxosarcina sp. GI1 TaxID=1541065 RepID=UPI00055DDF48|nr:nitrile hydratase subunit alpha [Myxosarcina sp. GI1]